MIRCERTVADRAGAEHQPAAGLAAAAVKRPGRAAIAPLPTLRGLLGNPIALGIAGLVLIAVAMGGALWACVSEVREQDAHRRQHPKRRALSPGCSAMLSLLQSRASPAPEARANTGVGSALIPGALLAWDSRDPAAPDLGSGA